MKIYVVIPVHNRKKITRDCLLSLRQQADQNSQSIVLDDGSTDGTGEMIGNEFPEVTLLHGDGNLWWTGAINKGLQYVLGVCNFEDYILLLNNDLVLPRDYTKTLTELANSFPNTIIGSVVVDIDDRETICRGGMKINWITAKNCDINTGKKISSFPKGFFTEASTLTGRGVLIPSKVFREIGLYNNKHYQQCGDHELPKRAEYAGYKLIVCYDAVVYSYKEDTKHINNREEYRLSDIKEYYWGIRSNSNLRYRFWFAFDTSSNVLYGTIFLIFDLARITNHFIRRLRL